MVGRFPPPVRRSTHDHAAPKGRYGLAACAVLALGGAAPGFSLLDHRSQALVESGSVLRWADYSPDQPLVLTYAIAEDFLDDEPPEIRADAILAIESALQSWSDATNGFLRFELAPWAAERNQGDSPPDVFVGPPIGDWFEDFQACAGDQACIDALDRPGWGAHIDFFSEPVGYSVYTGSRTYTMDECNLGFAAVHRDTDLDIASVDIYLSEKWDWTTNADDVTPIAQAVSDAMSGSPVRMCACCAGHARAAEDRSPCAGLELTVDIETVVLHEVGHALGLDHSDLALANGGVVIDPFTFAFLGPGGVSQTEVMDADYAGVRRELTEHEIGGMAYLYPPAMLGDITGDGLLTVADALIALDIFEGRRPADPWSVNRLDFLQRNGRIDVNELDLLTLWVFEPDTHPPGVLPVGDIYSLSLSPPTSVTVESRGDPEDVGVGGTFELFIDIANPDAVSVRVWDIVLRYDSDVLINPRYGTARDFLEGQSLSPIQVTPVGPGQSDLRTASFGFDEDDALGGTLVSIVFDIDLGAASLVPDVDLEYQSALIVVADSSPFGSHTYGMDPNFPDETLTLTDLNVRAYLLDLNADGVFCVNDAYDYGSSPADVNNDGQVTAYDRMALLSELRRLESRTWRPGESPTSRPRARPWRRRPARPR